eukprot:752264-Hanusia_phi.AAC.3
MSETSERLGVHGGKQGGSMGKHRLVTCVTVWQDAIVNQWLWEGGVSTVLSKFLTRFKRFRHCLSLDATSLLIATGIHNLSYSTSIAVILREVC